MSKLSRTGVTTEQRFFHTVCRQILTVRLHAHNKQQRARFIFAKQNYRSVMEIGTMISQGSLKIQDIRAIIQRYFDNTCSEVELSLVHYWYTLLPKRCYDRDQALIPLEQRIWEQFVRAN
jgi:hypothetical protein